MSTFRRGIKKPKKMDEREEITRDYAFINSIVQNSRDQVSRGHGTYDGEAKKREKEAIVSLP